MSPNKPQIIKKLLGNLTNSIVHSTLAESTDIPELKKRYFKEAETSMNIALKNRHLIHPIDLFVTAKLSEKILSQIQQKVKIKLKKRISDGYQNINIAYSMTLIGIQLEKLKIKKNN